LTNGKHVDIMGNRIKKHVEEKSKLWNVSERGRRLEMPYQETVENYLRVALIRSGDSVTIK
jgi:adenosyl cobinamide kinase/adenosyl cobinamide phosphate guanylyltransferase